MDTSKIKTLGRGLFTLLLLVAVTSHFFAAGIDATDPIHVSEDVLLYPDGSGTLSETQGVENFDARQSLGTTVKFTGASDSYLSGSADIQRDSTWTVSTWAQLDSSVDQSNATMRVLELGGWIYIDFNQSEWRVTYYDDSSLNVYVVNVSAPSPAENWTHLTVQRNSSELVVYRNNTQGGSVALTDANSVDGNFSADNFHGRVEETRVLDDELNSSQRQSLIDEPTAPLKANETARIYYDYRAGESSVDVYRTGSDLGFSNVRRVSGFAGQPVSESGLLGGGDYELSGGTVTAVDGGRLDGAPVVFVEYDYAYGPLGAALETLIGVGQAAFALVALGILVYGASFASGELDGF